MNEQGRDVNMDLAKQQQKHHFVLSYLSIVYACLYLLYCHGCVELLSLHDLHTTQAFAHAKPMGQAAIHYYLLLITFFPLAGILVDLMKLSSNLVLCSVLCLCIAAGYLLPHWRLSASYLLLMSFSLSYSFIFVLTASHRYLSTDNFLYLLSILFSVTLFTSFICFSTYFSRLQEQYWAYYFIAPALLALVGFVLAAKYQPGSQLLLPHKQVFHSWLRALKDYRIWHAGIYAGLIFVPLSTFADFWGKSYLLTTYSFTPAVASLISHILLFGAVVGCPLMALLSRHTKLSTQLMLLCAFASFVLMLCILYLPIANIALLCALFFLCGISLSSYMLSFFVISTSHRGPEGAGLRFALTSSMKLLVSVGVITVTSHLLLAHWSGELHNHQIIYSHFNYAFTLSLIPVCIALAVIVAYLLHSLKIEELFRISTRQKPTPNQHTG